MKFKNLYRSLSAVDVLIIVFTNFLSFLGVLFFREAEECFYLIIINLAIGIFIVVLGMRIGTAGGKFFSRLHEWYPVPMIFFIFKEVHVVIQSMGRHDWDVAFILIDRIFFGADPTVWLTKYSTPLLTEVLQVAYASYYFIMLAVGIELYLRKEKETFRFSVFVITYGFVLSYVGYLVFPAVGPRFTLHDFYTINTDLPGLWLTNSLRDLINAGESIPKGAANAVMLAQRDVFPSGHTQMTLISIYLAHRHKLKGRYIVDLLGILLIISTVYLRYHYVVDLAGGIFFTVFTLLTAPVLVGWWGRIRKYRRETGR